MSEDTPRTQVTLPRGGEVDADDEEQGEGEGADEATDVGSLGNISCLHTLSLLFPVNTPYQCILSMHPVNTSYQPILSTYPINPPYQPTLSTHPINPPYQPNQPTLSIHPVSTHPSDTS